MASVQNELNLGEGCAEDQGFPDCYAHPNITSLASFSPSAPVDAPATALVVGAGRPAEVVAFEAEVVAFFVDAAALLGVPKSVAAIYGMCFASPKALVFKDLGARLALSKGSISQGLKVLREVGALKETVTSDSRAKAYVPDTKLRQLVGHFLETRVSRQLEASSQRILRLKSGLAGLPASEQRSLRVRVVTLQRWHERTRDLLPLARTLLRFGV